MANKTTVALTLEQYKEIIVEDPDNHVEALQLLREKHDVSVIMVGLCTEVKKIFTKKSGRPMMFLKLEDMTGIFEVVVFPDVYEKHSSSLEEGRTLQISGKISVEDTKATLLAEEIKDMDTAPRTVWVRLNSPEQNLDDVLYIKGICAKSTVKHDWVKVYYRETKKVELVAWCEYNEVKDQIYSRFPKEDVEMTM